jgi:hypothetical protein
MSIIHGLATMKQTDLEYEHHLAESGEIGLGDSSMEDALVLLLRLGPFPTTERKLVFVFCLLFLGARGPGFGLELGQGFLQGDAQEDLVPERDQRDVLDALTLSLIEATNKN